MPGPSLIGRDQELGVLTDLIDRIRHGGGTILVLGEPGIGKSSLLRAAADYGRQQSLRVLVTTGIEAEAQLPFAGLHQLLWPVLDAAGRLPEAQQSALSAAFGTGGGQRPEPFIIALATLNLLADLAAQQPVLLVVDDANWLDKPSQDVLTFIARRVGADPIVVIASIRTGHDVALASAALPELDVRGLDDRSARALLAAHGGDLTHASQERILREALGNPLALVELPKALRGSQDPALEMLPLTARLERAFAARIADLPPLARDAVLIAAVDHADELPEILAGASVLAGQQVSVGALQEAASAGLIWFDDLHVRFRHPLMRSGIVQLEPAARRYAANAALAEVLVDDPYRRAWHRASSITGPDDAVADELEDSYVIALRRGSVTGAIWALERSAQLTTDSAKRGRRLLLAAEHAFGLGRADELLTRAARTSLSRLDHARMAWLREIFNDGVPGDADRVFGLCGMAREAIGEGDSGLALNLLLGAALRCWWADTGPAARAQVTAVAHLIMRPTENPRYAAVLAVSDPVAQGREVIGILDAVVLENVTDPAALWMLGMAAHAVGDPVHAVDFLGRAESQLRQQGRLALLSQVLAMQVLDCLELGDWDRAAAAVEEAQQLAHETGQPIWDTGSLSVHAIVIALRGDHEKAQAVAAEVEHSAGGRRLTNLLACVQLARGFALISAGEYTQGYEALRHLYDPADPAFHLTERFHGVMYLAEAAAHAGRAEDARPVIAALEADAVTTPAPTLHLHLAYAKAVLAGDDEAEKLFLAALRAGLTRWPWLRARLELAYGAWLRRQLGGTGPLRAARGRRASGCPGIGRAERAVRAGAADRPARRRGPVQP
jgi:hypothetical protein